MLDNTIFRQYGHRVRLAYCYATTSTRGAPDQFDQRLGVEWLLLLEISTVLHYDLWRDYLKYLESEELKAAVDELYKRLFTLGDGFETRLAGVQSRLAEAMAKFSPRLPTIYRSDYYRELSGVFPRPRYLRYTVELSQDPQ